MAEGCVVDTQFYNNYYAVVDKKIATTSADDVVFPDPAIKIDIGCIRNSTAYSGMNYIYVEPVTRTVNGQDYTNAETTDTKELQVSTLVVNAERIMDGGLTLISPQRVYLKGDINTYRVGTTEEGWQPTSLISNSIAFSLSDNFQDYGEIRNSPASTCSSGDFGDADCDGPQHLPGLYHGTETYPNPLEYPYNQSTTSLYPGMLNPKANAGGTVDQYISLVSPHSSTYFNIEIGTNVNLHGSIIQIPYNYNGWTNKSSSLSTYYHSRLSQGAPTIAWANKLQTYYDTNLVDTKPPGDFTGSSGRAWLNLEEADFNTNRKF